MKKEKIIALLLMTTLFASGCSMLPFGNSSQSASSTSEVSEGSEESKESEEKKEEVNKVLDDARLTEKIDEAAKYDFDNNKVFGSAYYVYDNGTSVEKCYGNMSLSSNEPITNTTLFRLASMSKPITTVATLVAMERGLLSLDDTIDKYLPQFKHVKIIDANGQQSLPKKLPTIMNILTHTSGIGSDAKKLSAMTKADQATLDAAVSFYGGSGLDFEPGTKQAYSATGSFDVLVKIIETVTGKDYLEFLKEAIFEPCNMKDTTFIPTEEQWDRLVDMHERVNGENAVCAMPEGCIFGDVPVTHYLGGAGLVSTLQDYANFAKMLLNGGQGEKGKVISKTSVKLMSNPQVTADIMPGNQRWGLGVRVVTDESYPHLPVGSFGWSGAYGSHFWIDPTNNIFAVYMKNSQFDGGSSNESGNKFEAAVYSSLLN